MEKFVPFEKLSKKKQRELQAKRRVTWGGLNPVTRKPKNPKAYDRKKARRSSPTDDFSVPYVFKRSSRFFVQTEFAHEIHGNTRC